MAVVVTAVIIYALLQGIDGQFTVVIFRSPAGTPVSGSNNTFDYPILSSVNLTCNVTSNNGSLFTVTSYQWNILGCYTNSRFTSSGPECFPHGNTTQNVIGKDLNAEDGGNISCTARIGGSNYTSEPLTLRISGIALINTQSFASADALTNYSYINATRSLIIGRCLTGLGPSGNDNGVLGGLYFNGNRIPNRAACSSENIIQPEPGTLAAGVINIRQCGEFSTAAEGIYTCKMINNLMMNQSIIFGIYFTGRTAPVIDPPSSSTVTVDVGSSLTLSCTSRNSPPGTFTWRKNNGPVLESITTPVDYTTTSAVFRADYLINSVTTSDSGTYICTVTNPIGNSSATITVVDM